MRYYLIVFLIGTLLLVYGFAASSNTESEFEGGKLKDTSSLPFLISGFLLILGSWAIYDASGKKTKDVKISSQRHNLKNL